MSTNAETTATSEQATATTTKVRKTGGNRGKHDEIMSYVESELKANKEISNPDLFEKAREKFPTLKRGWDSRKFNGTFNLPSKRRLGMIGGRKPGRPARATMPARTANKAISKNRFAPKVRADGLDSILTEFARESRKVESVEGLFDMISVYSEKIRSL